MILSEIGGGTTIEELPSDFPYLEREDILQSLRYAAFLAQNERSPSLTDPHLRFYFGYTVTRT